MCVDGKVKLNDKIKRKPAGYNKVLIDMEKTNWSKLGGGI